MSHPTSRLRVWLAIAAIVWGLYLGPRGAPRVYTIDTDF